MKKLVAKVATLSFIATVALSLMSAPVSAEKIVIQGITVNHMGCLDGRYFCVATVEEASFRKLVKSMYDFEWIKKMNNLPSNTTLDSPLEINVMYVLQKSSRVAVK
jgi:hypothetical protein